MIIELKKLNNKKYGVVFFLLFSRLLINNFFSDQKENAKTYFILQLLIATVSFLFVGFGNYWSKIDKKGSIYCFVLSFLTIMSIGFKKLNLSEGLEFLFLVAITRHEIKYDFLIKFYTIISILAIFFVNIGLFYNCAIDL